MAIEWREASAGGQTFRYVDSGEGPLVLLLHGFPDLPTGWDSIRARLNAAGFRTVAPYLRGYHPDTFSDRGFATSDQADDVVLLLDALGEATAVVVGHDWGAEATYSSATQHPPGSVVTRSAEMLSTVSLALFDTTPSAPTAGNSVPARRTPASRHRPSSFSRPFLTRTQVSVRGTQSGESDPQH